MSKGGSLKEQLKVVDEQLNEEVRVWHLHGIDPSGVNINGFLLDNWFFGLKEFLIEKGIITEDEVDLFVKKRLLNKLKEIRPEILQSIEEQKNQIVKAVPGIIGPDGTPLKPQ